MSLMHLRSQLAEKKTCSSLYGYTHLRLFSINHLNEGLTDDFYTSQPLFAFILHSDSAKTAVAITLCKPNMPTAYFHRNLNEKRRRYQQTYRAESRALSLDVNGSGAGSAVKDNPRRSRETVFVILLVGAFSGERESRDSVHAQ